MGRMRGKKKIGSPKNRSAGVSLRSGENAEGKAVRGVGEMVRVVEPGDEEKKEGHLNEVISGEALGYSCGYGAYYLWLFGGVGRGLEAIQKNSRC
jgi:hypothetical protein